MPHDATLLADIGGTHARFALLAGDAVVHPIVLRCAEHDGPVAAARIFLAAHPDFRPTHGAFAVAAVVDGDAVEIPNSGWRFSLAATRDALGLARLDAINDFTATALAVPRLAPGHSLAIGGGAARAGSPVAVLGPGTGLGVSALIPGTGGDWMALETEGGHATMAAATDREADLLGRLRREFGHVSAERVLSGQGLVNLYRAASGDGAFATPDQISRHGLDGTCRHCREALDTFFAMLGTVAANLALSVGARGGLFIAGGILPRMTEALDRSAFRARFEDHGRFGPYLAAIPTRLIIHPHPAFLGLAGMA